MSLHHVQKDFLGWWHGELDQTSDADRTAFEGAVRFLQKGSGPGPVQGLVVRSMFRPTVQKYKSLCAYPMKFTLFHIR